VHHFNPRGHCAKHFERVLFTQFVLVVFHVRVSVAFQLTRSRCLFIFGFSKFFIGLVLEHTLVPTVVVFGPIFQADPAPQVAAAVRLALTAHAIAARGPLHSGLATGGSFGVG